MSRNSATIFNQAPTKFHCQRFIQQLHMILLCVLVPVFFLVTTSTAHATASLTLAHVSGRDDPIGRGGDQFAKNLEQVSKGKMTVKVIPEGALGGIREIWAQMQVGAVDMQVIDLGAISMLKPAKAMQVVMLPYLFESQEHFRTFTNSELRAEMTADIMDKAGIRYLGIVADRSPRIISTTGKVVKSVKDVAGLKIRVPGHPMFIKVFKSWGAVPTPISPSEMFMALKSGLVEAEDNGIAMLVNTSNREVIKSVTPINWTHAGVAAWIAESRWKLLSEQQRTWINEAITLTEQTSAREYKQRMQDAQTKLTELGIATQEADIESFKTAIHNFHEQFDDIWPAGTVEKIRAMAD